ncbi:hypothetical protein ID866_9011 [Astraeus odoratus]|nr:hypothetical protein ID866_9011 [Astraeus odoratus]
MVPTPLHSPRSSRLLITLFSVLPQHVPGLTRKLRGTDEGTTLFHTYAKRASSDPHSPEFIVFVCLIPVLVLLSGVFAGLTLGYMSLDETQLNVLSMSGTPQQKRYANKIKPIRKDGHLLLVTLLLANMIVNETLPVISDPVLGGGVQSVVVSTVLIVIFSEIIPQSLCTRHGLYLGAKMAGFTQFLIYFLGVVAWPVAKLLEFILGPHHGIIYRRAELKELIAMHSSISPHGGDLNTDTVTIIGATLDLQEKVVKQAMTPIENVFMLSIDSTLDYESLKRICLTGHSRVPVYEEVEVPANSGRMEKVKRIIGILLVKHCVLLDPKDSIPLRKLPLNKVPFVPNNESLLGILDKFQEGRSHMAIVSRFSVEKAASIKKVAKRSLTQRLRERVGIGDSSDSSGEESDSKEKCKQDDKSSDTSWTDNGKADKEGNLAEEKRKRKRKRFGGRGRGRFKRNDQCDIEMGEVDEEQGKEKGKQRIRLSRPSLALEQTMPADAVLTKKDADDFLQIIDPAINPLGIITLEDVLEGEEIYDEFDSEGANGRVSSYVPAELPHPNQMALRSESTPDLHSTGATVDAAASSRTSKSIASPPALRPLTLKGLGFLRSRSAPPSPRDKSRNLSAAFRSRKDTLTTVLDRENEVQGSPPSTVPESADVPHTPKAEDKDEGTPRLAADVLLSDSNRVPSSLGKKANSNTALPAHVAASSTTSRSGSPAPAFEAFLLDRKRRLTASGKEINSKGVSRPPLSRVVTPSIKGSSKFKSSPLGGGERAGIVVAEKIKEDMKGQEEEHGADESNNVGN